MIQFISRFAILAMVIIGSFAGQVETLAQGKAHFVIDPGHGGKDPGSQFNGVVEKDLTLDLATRIRSVLTGRGFAATLTRDKDEFVALEDRAGIANKIPGSILLSIHFNAHEDRTVAGIETFYWPGSVEGQRLAKYIQGELGRRIVTRDRGFKPEEFGVLKTQATAALVECGFISNRWECQRCQASWFKQVLAEEIAQALIRYSTSARKAFPLAEPVLFQSPGGLPPLLPSASINSPVGALPLPSALPLSPQGAP